MSTTSRSNKADSFAKNNLGAEGQGGADEDRLYHCAECGEAADLGAIDEEDGQWYCKSCWEALLAGDDADGAKAGADDSSAALAEGSGYNGPVDEDAEGVAIVLSDGGPGFCISEDGLGLLRARGKDYAVDEEGRDIPRVDPDLVALVRKDADRMARNGGSLVVRRVPREAYDSGGYHIHNLDGKEILAIDPDVVREQAKALAEIRSQVEEQDRERPALAKLLAALHHVLYQGEQRDEERLNCLRKLAPAEMLRTNARPTESLLALAGRADNIMGTDEG